MIEVKVNTEDFDRVIRAINNVEKVVIGLKDSITEESAREFSSELVHNITSQRFGDFGARRASSWKKGFANESDFWMFLGTALKSINPIKISSSSFKSKWFVGFDYAGSSSPGKKGGTESKSGFDKNKRLALIKHRVKVLQEQRHSTVRHISIEGYVPQKKTYSQTLIRK